MAIAHTYGLDVNMDSDPDPGRGQRDVWGATIKVGQGAAALRDSGPVTVRGSQGQGPRDPSDLAVSTTAHQDTRAWI